MGAIAVWVLRHGKIMLAWTILITAFTLFVSSVSSSSAFSAIGNSIDSAVTGITSLATLVPRHVASINNAIRESLNESNGIAQLMYYLAGFDTLQSILSFIAGQISGIVTMVVVVGGSGLALAGFAWILKRTQRLVVAITGSDLNGSQIVD